MKKWHKKKQVNDLRRWRDYVKCEKCGHTLPMKDKEKGFCTYCGRYIFLNDKLEFNYRLKEKMRSESN
ncbi:hypothetical protein IKS57_02765 [bacterium]|nr:hypothetical protein [bacterium]